MVDVADINRAVGLAAESQRLGEAIAAVNVEDVKIMQMMVGPGFVQIDTSEMQYPPQMRDAILAMLQTRKQAVDQELTTLGVTGMDREPEGDHGFGEPGPNGSE